MMACAQKKTKTKKQTGEENVEDVDIIIYLEVYSISNFIGMDAREKQINFGGKIHISGARDFFFTK